MGICSIVIESGSLNIALDGGGGGGSRFHMSIGMLNVALSNLRNAHVNLAILRNDYVPCHYPCRMSLSPKRAHVALWGP